jgi:hypothetical protein
MSISPDWRFLLVSWLDRDPCCECRLQAMRTAHDEEEFARIGKLKYWQEYFSL